MDEYITLSRDDLRRQLAEIQARLDSYPSEDYEDERELYLDGGREEILKRLLGEEE